MHSATGATQQIASARRDCSTMQSVLRVSHGASTLSNPLLGNRMSYRVAPVAAPIATTATRQVTCMAKKKGVRIIVTLECTEARGEGVTPSRYVSQKVSRELRQRGSRQSHARSQKCPP